MTDKEVATLGGLIGSIVGIFINLFLFFLAFHLLPFKYAVAVSASALWIKLHEIEKKIK